MPLRLNSRFVGDVYVIRCSGRIVAGEEVHALETALDLGVRDFSRLVLHLAEVERLDSTGMGLLVRYAANTRRRAGDIRLASPPPFIVSLLNATKLSSVLQVHETEEDAIVSFVQDRKAQGTHYRRGQRVLVLDESPDVCAFVRGVLIEHGYDVRSISSFRDARIMLQADSADYIVVGPGNPQLTPETMMQSLRALAPHATICPLGADFRNRDAHEAGQALLRMLGNAESF